MIDWLYFVSQSEFPEIGTVSYRSECRIDPEVDPDFARDEKQNEILIMIFSKSKRNATEHLNSRNSNRIH